MESIPFRDVQPAQVKLELIPIGETEGYRINIDASLAIKQNISSDLVSEMACSTSSTE